jgi:hypothetical protein
MEAQDILTKQVQQGSVAADLLTPPDGSPVRGKVIVKMKPAGRSRGSRVAALRAEGDRMPSPDDGRDRHVVPVALGGNGSEGTRQR